MASAWSTSASVQPFGPLLRRLRLAAGLSQEALAERAQVSTRTVSDLERGINRAPRHETLLLLVEALHLDDTERQLLTLAARPELTAPADLPAAPPLIHLPQPSSAIFGRDDDIQRAIDLLLGPARLVTLVGPGGVGKTRLAVEVARRSAPAWSDGVEFVDLSELQEAELVATELALRLGLRPALHRDVTEALGDALANRWMLLVLDNFERVIGAAALVALLLEHGAELRILATSRVALRIRAETVLHVQPLAPAAAHALLADRAAAAGVPAPIDPATAARLCQLGDHLPLAIELLAMRLPTQTPALLLDRLSSSLGAFSAEARDLPPRQRALSATIRWSYNLLSSAEQSLFRCLGVFEGGSRLWDIRAIWESGESADAIPDALSALVEHSLLHIEETAEATEGGPRYRMLDTIHAFARQMLRDSGEWDARQRAHAEHFAALALEVVEVSTGQDRRDAALWGELSNVRAARVWAHEHGARSTELRLATVSRLLYMHGLSAEALHWIDVCLAHGASWITAQDDAQLWAKACYGAARVLFDAGDLPAAERRVEDGIEMERAHGLDISTAELLSIAGQIAQQQGDLAAAGERYAEALAHARAAGNAQSMGTVLSGAAQVAVQAGAFDKATTYLTEALELSERLELAWSVALLQTHLGQATLAQRDIAASREHFRAALACYRQVGNELYLAWCLEGLAAAELGGNMAARTAWLCGAADTLRERARGPRPASEQSAFERTVAAARSVMGDAAFDAAWDAGHAASREAIIAFALNDGSESSHGC
jgi:predicted ATPase/transcriptional regulator with XRE-family HTH domain